MELTLKEEKIENDINVIRGIFEPTPEKWGLRGDPYLWEDLKKSIKDEGISQDLSEFENQILRLFMQKTGKSIFDKNSVFVDEYAKGGMSSGQVSIDTWRNKLIPLIMTRYKNSKDEI